MSIDTRCPSPLLSSSLNILSELGVKNELVRSLAFLRATPKSPPSPPSGLKLLLYIGGRGVQDGLKFEADSAKRRLSPSWKTVTRERRFFEKKFLTEVRFVREERM